MASLLSRRELVWLNAISLLFVACAYFSQPSILHSLDYVLFYKPNFQFLIDSIGGGNLPLWNPYIGLGRPFLADVQNAVFYPPIYLILILGKEWGLFLLVFLHCSLAVTGMTLFARTVGVGKMESYFVSFSYMAGAALTGRFFAGQIFYCFAACYLPWLFFYARKTAESFSLRTAGIYALFLALQFLCGHPQMFWISMLGQIVLILSRNLSLSFLRSIRMILRDGTIFTLSLVWSAGLVAVVLLPFLELVRHGNRNASSLEFSNYGRMEWSDFLGFLVGPQSDYILSWESNYYAGLLLLFPGIAGLVRFVDRDSRALFGVGVVSVLIALGGNTPLFGWLYHYLPGIGSFRLHARTLILLVFALSVTAGIWLTRRNSKSGDFAFFFGAGAVLIFVTYHLVFRESSLEILSQAARPQAAIMLWGALLFTLLLALLKHVRSRMVPGCLGAFVLCQGLDLTTANMRLKREYSFQAVMNWSDDFPYQHAVRKALANAHLLGESNPPPRVCISPNIIPVNYGMIHGYSHFDAYTSLFLRGPWEFLHQSIDLPIRTNKNTSVSRAVYDREAFPYGSIGLVLGWDRMHCSVILRTNSSPRVFLVCETEKADESPSIRAATPTRSEIDEIDYPGLLTSLPSTGGANLDHGSVKYIRFEPNQIDLEVEAKRDALLVLAEAAYPGWYARMDERTIPSVVANSWMRAFSLPAGKHHVVVFFRQNYLLCGALITLLSSGVLCVVLFKSPRNYSNLNSSGGETAP